jgi:hypothetical protein
VVMADLLLLSGNDLMVLQRSGKCGMGSKRQREEEL